jgi:hypothetical protein
MLSCPKLALAKTAPQKKKCTLEDQKNGDWV